MVIRWDQDASGANFVNPGLRTGMKFVPSGPVGPRLKAITFLAAALQDESSADTGDASTADRDDLAQITYFQELIVEEKFDEAEPLLETYLSGHPDSWKAHYFRGYVLFRQRKIGESIRELAKSLALNTKNAEAHKVLGRCLLVIGRYDLSQTEFEEALRLEPNSAPEIHYNLGRVRAAQDDFHQARSEFEAAIQLDPMYMEAHNALGFAMEALRDDAAALESYHNAIRLNEARGGNFEAPYVNLSGFYNRRGQLELALEYARKAIRLNPKSDLAYFQLCKAHRMREEWAQAAEAVEKAIEISPHTAKYHYVLSLAYRKLGKQNEARQTMQRFHELQKEIETFESMRREARRAEQGLEDRVVE